MPNPHCFASLQVCALRVARLDASGVPSAGASNGYVTDGLITLGVTTELTEGDEFEVKNGCGAICAVFKDCDRVKRLTFDMSLCHLDSELLELLAGGSVFVDGGGDAIGYQYPEVGASACPNGVALEVWTKAWDNDTQAQPTYVGGNTYFHFVFPRTYWSPGQFTLENGILEVPLTGYGTENANITSNGPYEDWPTEIESAGGIYRVGGWFFDGTLPTAACGYTEVPAQGS